MKIFHDTAVGFASAWGTRSDLKYGVNYECWKLYYMWIAAIPQRSYVLRSLIRRTPVVRTHITCNQDRSGSGSAGRRTEVDLFLRKVVGQTWTTPCCFRTLGPRRKYTTSL